MRKRLRLTASYFYDDVVRVIGEITKFEPGSEVFHTEVIEQILTERSLDPFSEGFSKDPNKKVPRVVILIGHAFRNQRPEYLKGESSRKGAYIPYCKQGSRRGMWMLTPEGVAYAKALDPKSKRRRSPFGIKVSSEEVVASPVAVVETTEVETPVSEPEGKAEETPNLTREYFAKHWSTLYPLLCKGLCKRIPPAKDNGLLEDHVMTFVTYCIAKDLFARCLSQGETPRFGNIIRFAHHSALNEIRPWGRDLSARAMLGVISEQERAQAKKNNPVVEISVRPISASRIPQNNNEEQGKDFEEALSLNGLSYHGGTGDNLIPSAQLIPSWHDHPGYSTHIEDQIIEKEIFSQCMLRVEKIIGAITIPARKGRLQCILRGLIKGKRATEIAKDLCLNRKTVSYQVREIHRVLQKAREKGEFLGVLD